MATTVESPQDRSDWGNSHLNRMADAVVELQGIANGGYLSYVTVPSGDTSGVTDTAAINAAITALGSNGGTIVLHSGTYYVTDLSFASDNYELLGPGSGSCVLNYVGSADAITVTSLSRVRFTGFKLANTGTGVNGIKFAYHAASTGFGYRMKDVVIDGFTGIGLYLTNCELSHFEDVWARNCGSDGIKTDNTNHTGGSLGITLTFKRCRAETNTGMGWNITNIQGCSFEACESLNNLGAQQVNVNGNCRQLDINTFDIENGANAAAGIGLKISGTEHVVNVNCTSLATGVSFSTCTKSSLLPSKFSTVTTPVLLGSGSTDNFVCTPGYTVSVTDANNWIIQSGSTASKLPGTTRVNGSLQTNIALPTYSASITPDCNGGEWQTITVTNSTAFTVNAPTNPPASTRTQFLTIEVLNSSGGAMGVITWNAVFVFAGKTWTNPASTKKRAATFRWNGTAWVAVDVSGSDY